MTVRLFRLFDCNPQITMGQRDVSRRSFSRGRGCVLALRSPSQPPPIHGFGHRMVRKEATIRAGLRSGRKQKVDRACHRALEQGRKLTVDRRRTSAGFSTLLTTFSALLLYCGEAAMEDRGLEPLTSCMPYNQDAKPLFDLSRMPPTSLTHAAHKFNRPHCHPFQGIPRGYLQPKG